MGAPDEVETVVAKSTSWFGIRHVQSLLLFFAMLLGYAMRVNMSMAIVAMTDSTKDHYFGWSTQTQSVILSSFFWGYIVLQIPAGEISGRFGGKIPITSVIAINSAVSLLIPIAANYGGWQLVCACRVVQGLSQGFLFPSTHSLVGKWVPLEEKSRLGTFIYAGAQLGTALQLMASGFIAEAWGWPSIFYVNGALGAIWTVFYVFLGSKSPEDSGVISKEERDYIQNSLGQVGVQKKLTTPWKSIWTSLPFISLLIAHCGQNWGFSTLLTEMPSYMSYVLGIDIKANGMTSALPYLVMYLMSFPFGFMSELILKKGWLSITNTRKLSNTLGLWGPAVALIALSYAPEGNTVIAVALFTVAVGINAGQYTGFLIVHIDMAPNFAGTLMGITNMFANVISIIAPLAAGVMLKDETQHVEWRKVFITASAVYFVANLFFVVFGSCETQPWNIPKTENTTDDAQIEDAPENSDKIEKL